VSGVPRLAPGPGRPRRQSPPRRGPASRDPFWILGLEPRASLTDDEVHAAWRRIASATHPDREDGGDAQRFADAAAAYTTLRTRFGRGEALASLQAAGPSARAGRRPGVALLAAGLLRAFPRRLAARVAGGRPGRLALRTLAAAAASAGAVVAAGPHPAGPALVTGIATWLVLTARRDLAPAEPPLRNRRGSQAGSDGQGPRIRGRRPAVRRAGADGYAAFIHMWSIITNDIAGALRWSGLQLLRWMA
jgi:curved DNA-binding protein CbpA